MSSKPSKPSGRRAWSKFYWVDWDTDPALALCSMAAQGFWMRLLCIAASEDGYVRIGGKRPTLDQLATVTRQSVADVEAWVAELTEQGVCSLTQGRVIYSRRMREDAEKTREGRENGLKGGNPILLQDKGLSPPEPDQGVKAEAEAEAEAEREEPAAPASPARPEPPSPKGPKSWKEDPDFVAAWDACTPGMRKRSDGRERTWPAWRRAAAKAGGGAALGLAHRRYLAEDLDVKRTGGPSFTLWLTKERWEHWLVREPTGAAGEPDENRWRALLQMFRDGDGWKDRYGPAPGSPDCRAPPELLLEAGLTAAVIPLRREA